MIGFIIGAACAVGLGRLIRRRIWQGRLGFAPYGSACMGGRGGFGPGGRSRPGRWALRLLFERLETTPGQERVIVSALDELRDNRKGVEDELKQTRRDLATAIQGGLIEDTSLEDTFARHDRLVARLRVGFIESLRKVTDVLDEPQRKALARVLEGGHLFGGGWSGPGRVWA